MIQDGIFVQKYNPNTLQDMILDKSIKDLFFDYLNKKTIPNLLFSGSAGKGKTTIAKVLCNELNANVLFIPCGEEGNIETIKTKVKDFCNALSFGGVLKVIILDEVDQLSIVAQGALRNTIEGNLDDTRFILTCNYENKLLEPIRSRCTQINLKCSLEDILKKCISILDNEQIKYNQEILKEFVKTIVKKKYPDIRSIYNIMEMWSISGTLQNRGVIDKSEINEIIKYIQENKNPRDIRKYLIQNEEQFSSDYELICSEMFNAYQNDFKAQVLIAETLYKMGTVLDKEIQFASLIIQLKGF